MKQAASYRLAIAVRYWHAARLVIENQTSEMEHLEPVGHLLSMAVEIALKSHLVEKGVSDEVLAKKYGHDLRKCLRKAVQEGLRIEDDDAACVLNMQEAHMNHFNRYGPSAEEGRLKLGAFNLTDENLALDAVARLIDRVNFASNRFERKNKLIEDWKMTSLLYQPVTINRIEIIDEQVRHRVENIKKIDMKAHKSKKK